MVHPLGGWTSSGVGITTLIPLIGSCLGLRLSKCLKTLSTLSYYENTHHVPPPALVSNLSRVSWVRPL
ncbi:hypothetical protein Hanom_Chr04g00338961 [Helianthus anomalus]